MKPKLIALSAVVLGLCVSLNAQGINQFAASSYLRSANSESFMQPFLDVLGASVNSSALSYVHPDSNRKFHIYIGVYGTSAFISSNMKSFDGTTEAPYAPPLTKEVPTIFGENTTETLYDENGNAYTFPGGFDVTQIRLAFPIIHVGTLFHTNFSGRFIAADLGGDLKRIEVFGFGLNHFISDYWKAPNYFVSVGGSYNQFTIGDYAKGRHIMFQATGGQQIKNFNYFGFLQYMSSPYEFYYEDEEAGDGTVKLNGSNKLRFGAGCSYTLWKFKLNAELSLNNPFMASAGLGLQF